MELRIKMEPQVRFGTAKDFPFVKALCKESCQYSIHPLAKVPNNDYGAVADRYLSAFPPDWSDSSIYKLLILETLPNHEPIGYLILLVDIPEPVSGGKQTYFLDLSISSKYRGKAYWKLLFEKAEAMARERGNIALVGNVTITNPRALKMDISWGFQVERYEVVKRLV